MVLSRTGSVRLVRSSLEVVPPTGRVDEEGVSDTQAGQRTHAAGPGPAAAGGRGRCRRRDQCQPGDRAMIYQKRLSCGVCPPPARPCASARPPSPACVSPRRPRERCPYSPLLHAARAPAAAEAICSRGPSTKPSRGPASPCMRWLCRALSLVQTGLRLPRAVRRATVLRPRPVLSLLLPGAWQHSRDNIIFRLCPDNVCRLDQVPALRCCACFCAAASLPLLRRGH